MTTRYAGIGETLGDDLVTQSPLQVSGTIWFVHHSGSDSNAGDKGAPFATIGAAIAASSASDIIVLLDGHAEVLTAALTPLTSQIVVGSGRASGKPTVKIGLNSAGNINAFICSGAGVQLRNIWFQGNSQANSAVRIACSQSGFTMKDCYIECGQFDDNGAVGLASGADKASFYGNTFISTATSVATRPHSALRQTAAVNDLTLEGNVFSGGTNGFGNQALLLGSDITRLRMEGNSFLLNAHATVTSPSTGYVLSNTTSGGSYFNWDA